MLPSTTDDVLFDNLPTADLFRYGRTNRSAQLALQSYMRRRYQLNRLLSRFFSEQQTEELRTLMSATDMIISGSTALQFFDRIVYPDSDVDLYVPFKHARQVADWLVSAGYTYSPKKTSIPTIEIALRMAEERGQDIERAGYTPANHRGYLRSTGVLDFVTSYPPRKIQVMCALRSTLELILGFHSTCVMNFIAHDKAYSLFPRATFRERRALSYLDPLNGSDVAKNSYQKYSARGWQLQDSITRDEFDDRFSSFARGKRFVGDSKCWVLPVFPLRDDLPESSLTINSFDVVYNENLELGFYYTHVDFPGLRQPYFLVDHELKFVKELRLLPQHANHPTSELAVVQTIGDPDDVVAGDDVSDDAMTLDHTLKEILTNFRQLVQSRLEQINWL